ncbi:neutral ceramidase 2 [Elaeis guineensis]|uniref:Neutral ceramidase n=1 Tax=Elaeis guineensis var. tenera TaxID=51953 RepID=A0A6J0PHQ2_ELAGV|nr:neutral ceramidase 2 [Elaeis guineensis]
MKARKNYYISILSAMLACSILCDNASLSNGEYLIGVGSYDMTGPAADVNMMGYANLDQVTSGIHFRLRARAFIVAESQNGRRLAFVNLDAGMASQLVTIKVLERLRSRYGDLYNEDNIAISGTHTHAGPGGYLQYVLYAAASLGFVKQSFDVIVSAIEQSIVQAHGNLRPGSILINKGDVANAGINRSPSAYLFNPPEERAQYPRDVDPETTLLKFVDGKSQESIGAFNWFATHGTSMSRNNRLVSGDNKGVAARLFEDWFAAENNSTQPGKPKPTFMIRPGSIVRKKAMGIKATGGQSCRKTTSRNFKVRQNRKIKFVGAFCQSNVGDVTPNVLGAVCLDSGLPCDFNHSSCHGNAQLCVGHGPGYPDEIKSTRIIGERQFLKAFDLFNSAHEELSGSVDYRHTYLNFTNLQVELGGGTKAQTCPAAVGPGFAAGTTDGPGLSGFQQGDTEISEKWKRARDSLQVPSQQQVECQKPKAVLLSTGEMFIPYAWAPAILPIQILKIGKLVILSVPGEFTTMAGRRLREAVKSTLISSGSGEFDETTHVVIAGLSNAYSQYVATFEEYQQQRYEAASTLYGPHTLSAYIQEFKKLASLLAKGEQPPKSGHLSPPDLSSKLFSLLGPPTGDDTPGGTTFGDVKQDIVLPPRGSFKKGEKATATFWSANPRNDLLTEGTFAVVEVQRENYWVPAFDDDDLSLFFKWKADNSSSSKSSLATIEWEIPANAAPGVYRMRHFGSWIAKPETPPRYFTGASSSFVVK